MHYPCHMLLAMRQNERLGRFKPLKCVFGRDKNYCTVLEVLLFKDFPATPLLKIGNILLSFGCLLKRNNLGIAQKKYLL